MEVMLLVNGREPQCGKLPAVCCDYDFAYKRTGGRTIECRLN